MLLKSTKRARLYIQCCFKMCSVIFCSSWVLKSLGIFDHPFLSISPKAPVTASIVVSFIRQISISTSLYLHSFSVTFVEVFLLVGMP